MSAFVILCLVALAQAQTEFLSYAGTSIGRALRCQAQSATGTDSAWSPASDVCSAMSTTFVGRLGEKSAIVSSTDISWEPIPSSARPNGIFLDVQVRCTRCASFVLYGPLLQNSKKTNLVVISCLFFKNTLNIIFFSKVNGANHAINANFSTFNLRLSANTTFPWNSTSTLAPTKLVERFTTLSFFVGPEPAIASDAAINNIVLIASWFIDVRIALVEPSSLPRNQATKVSLWVIDRNLGATCDQLSLNNQIGAFDLSLDGVVAQVQLTEAVPQAQWSPLLRNTILPAQNSVACRINATITPTSNPQLIAFALGFKSGFQLSSSPITLIGAAPPTTPSTISTATTTTSTTEMSTEPTTTSEIVTESETTAPPIDGTTTTESSSDAIDVESPSNGAAIGGIIGGVVGGILLLACLGVAIFCILRRSDGGEQIQTSSLEAAPEARNSDTFVAAPTSAVAIPPPLTDRPVVVEAPMPVFVNNAAPPPPLPTVGTVTPAKIVATPPPPPPPPQPKGSKSPRGGPTNVQYTGLPNNQQGDAFQHGL
jgi:hypothetical protein